MIWKKKTVQEYSIENFYKEEKHLNELEFVYFETPRIMAKIWMFSLAKNLPTDSIESQLILELQKNDKFIKVEFEKENYCIFAHMSNGSRVELCTDTYMFKGEHAKFPEMSNL